jgi:hypothetical protein
MPSRSPEPDTPAGGADLGWLEASPKTSPEAAPDASSRASRNGRHRSRLPAPEPDPRPQLDAVDLEPLARWCGEALQRALDDRPAVAAPGPPPLPAHVWEPLQRGGLDELDSAVLALALAPDLDPVLAAATSSLSSALGAVRPTVAAIAQLLGAEGADRSALAVRLSDSGSLSRLGLLHIVAGADSGVQGQPPRGPSMLSTVVPATALLRWTFGITELDPALFPFVRDDLSAPTSPPDPRAASELADVLCGWAPSWTSLQVKRSGDGLEVALYAAAGVGRPVLAVDAEVLGAVASARRLAAEAVLRDAVVVVTGEVAQVPPLGWDALATTVAITPHPVLGPHLTRATRAIVVHPDPRSTPGAALTDLLRQQGSTSRSGARRMGRWEHCP